MSNGEILMVILAILIPLVIAVAVTLWTLQPAVFRNERARRARRTGTPLDDQRSPDTDRPTLE